VLAFDAAWGTGVGGGRGERYANDGDSPWSIPGRVGGSPGDLPGKGYLGHGAQLSARARMGSARKGWRSDGQAHRGNKRWASPLDADLQWLGALPGT